MSGGASRQGGPTTVFQAKGKHSRYLREHSRTLSRRIDCLPGSVDSLSILRQTLAR